MTGDRLIRAATAAVVTAVAAFAAVVSYSHVFDLGRLHGQSGTAARLLPLSVDGLILAASLVLLHEARNGRPAPALARCMLWLGVSPTLAANALYGLAWGVPGVALSAWPGAAFVGSVELLMGMVRRTRSAAPVPGTVPGPHLNGSGLLPAEAGPCAGELARGEVPGIRRIRDVLHVGQAKAQRVQAGLRVLAGTGAS